MLVGVKIHIRFSKLIIDTPCDHVKKKYEVVRPSFPVIVLPSAYIGI